MCSIDIHISFGGKTDIPPEIIGMFVGEHVPDICVHDIVLEKCGKYIFC